MTTRILAEIEKAIQRVVDDNCEAPDWPQMWWPDTLTPRMANAAYEVFQANHDAQICKDINEADK